MNKDKNTRSEKNKLVLEKYIKSYLEGVMYCLEGKYNEAKKEFKNAIYIEPGEFKSNQWIANPAQALAYIGYLKKTKLSIEQWKKICVAVKEDKPDFSILPKQDQFPNGKEKPDGKIRFLSGFKKDWDCLCHSCWGIYSLPKYIKNRCCFICGGHVVSTSSAEFEKVKGINFTLMSELHGIDVLKIDVNQPWFSQFDKEIKGRLTSISIGCIAAVMTFLPLAKMYNNGEKISVISERIHNQKKIWYYRRRYDSPELRAT